MRCSKKSHWPPPPAACASFKVSISSTSSYSWERIVLFTAAVYFRIQVNAILVFDANSTIYIKIVLRNARLDANLVVQKIPALWVVRFSNVISPAAKHFASPGQVAEHYAPSLDRSFHRE